MAKYSTIWSVILVDEREVGSTRTGTGALVPIYGTVVTQLLP